MHETGVIKSLIREVERVALRYDATKVLTVTVRTGALSPFSEDHLREHFQQQSFGTVAEQARLIVEVGTSPTDHLAQDVVLVSIEIEDVEEVEEVLPNVRSAGTVSAK
jgi:hydrogenase nickel incorporation protein HypA/HybF